MDIHITLHTGQTSTLELWCPKFSKSQEMQPWKPSQQPGSSGPLSWAFTPPGSLGGPGGLGKSVSQKMGKF